MFFLTGNYRKAEIKEHLPRFLDYLRQSQIEFAVDRLFKEFLNDENLVFLSIEEALEKPLKMILTFGGDGTILYTAQKVLHREIPLLGFNLGGLGFLADSGMDELSKMVEYIRHDAYNVDSRNVLSLSSENREVFAFNDIVFDKAGYRRVIEIQTFLDEQLINAYIADGLIISTPTGSTGYNLSAGGPIVVSGADVTVISPICPHSLTMRPLVVPAQSEIKVMVRTEAENFICNVDGQEFDRFPSGKKFTIKLASFKLKLVKIEGHDIFSILRNKLRWGIDFRNKKRWSYDT